MKWWNSLSVLVYHNSHMGVSWIWCVFGIADPGWLVQYEWFKRSTNYFIQTESLLSGLTFCHVLQENASIMVHLSPCIRGISGWRRLGRKPHPPHWGSGQGSHWKLSKAMSKTSRHGLRRHDRSKVFWWDNLGRNFTLDNKISFGWWDLFDGGKTDGRFL